MNKTDLNITQSETWLNAKFNFQSIRHRSVIMFKAMFSSVQAQCLAIVISIMMKKL